MKYFILLLLCSLNVSAATIPDVIDMRAKNQPLIEVISSIAKQCNAGLVIHSLVQERVAQPVTINARKTTWADTTRWFADEYRISFHLVNNHLEIGDADADFRARLETRRYNMKLLLASWSSFPALGLIFPAPGGYEALILPAQNNEESATEMSTIITLIQKQIAPDTWDIDGVGINEYGLNYECLVIFQVPEVHKQIAELLAKLERVAARQIMVRCYRLADATAPQTAIVDPAAWSTLVKNLAAPIGITHMSDEQMNYHFSGKQSAHIMDADVNQQVFDPIVTIISQGLSFDCKAHVTRAGVVATVRFDQSSETTMTTNTVTSDKAQKLQPLELPQNNIVINRDTRIVPNGGAAIYRFGNQVYALSFEVLDYAK